MVDIFYGKDIPLLFPKPEYRPETSDILPDGIYMIDEFNYHNNSISFKKCKWLRPESDLKEEG